MQNPYKSLKTTCKEYIIEKGTLFRDFYWLFLNKHKECGRCGKYTKEYWAIKTKSEMIFFRMILF